LRTVLTTADLSLVESFRLALETEGIPSRMSNQNAGALPFNLVSVDVLDDDAYGRALEALHGLQHTTRPSLRNARPSRKLLRVLVVLLLIVTAILCGNIFIQ